VKDKPTVRTCWTAWMANLGRAPVEGEAAEFAHVFDGADAWLLRRALDDYFAANPPFPRIPGLRATYNAVSESQKAANRPAPWLGPQLPPAEIREALRGGGWAL
jgi:hypothetical protein